MVISISHAELFQAINSAVAYFPFTSSNTHLILGRHFVCFRGSVGAEPRLVVFPIRGSPRLHPIQRQHGKTGQGPTVSAATMILKETSVTRIPWLGKGRQKRFRSFLLRWEALDSEKLSGTDLSRLTVPRDWRTGTRAMTCNRTGDTSGAQFNTVLKSILKSITNSWWFSWLLSRCVYYWS